MAQPARRELIRRLALAVGLAVALPVVQTIVAPNAYAAGSPCTTAQCQTDDPIYRNKCCDAKHKLCIITKGIAQDCKGSGC